ncbi:MAG: hypothetical protein ACN6QY_28390, partial [Pseudomonas sp.]|uniref:hypothetical protein n=1 Tax=Pseudomonas sp. TaxID=306 RepID=UPI003D0EE187
MSYVLITINNFASEILLARCLAIKSARLIALRHIVTALFLYQAQRLLLSVKDYQHARSDRTHG